MDDKFIVHGPPIPTDSIPHLNKSLNNYIIELLLCHNKDDILMIDAVTQEQLKVADILRSSLRIAAALQFIGCKPGDIVGVICENRVDYVILVLAILHMGGVLTMFSTAYTTDDLKHTLKLSKPKFVLSSGENLHKLVELRDELSFISKIIVIDEIDLNNDATVLSLPSLLKEHDASLKYTAVKIDSDNLATIIYTSGTTGYPKGVSMTHKSIVFLLELCRTGCMPKPSGKYIIGNVPMYHGYGVFLSLRCLVLGFTLLIAKKFDELLFLSTIEKYRVKFLYLTPPTITFLAKSSLVDSYDLSSVDEIFSGASQLWLSVREAVINRLNLKTVLRGYGQTEIFVSSVTSRGNKKPKSYGHVLHGIQCKIIDFKTRNAISPYKSGEVCFRGPNVMKGYYGNEELTKQTIDEDGWIHTGDVGYFDKEGDFFLIDRENEIISCSNFQVSITDLESLLLKHEAIKDAGVIAVPNEVNDQRLKCFVVKKIGSHITENDVIQYLSDNALPQNLLRASIVFMDEIPKNPSGKILKRVLQTLA